MADKRRRQRLKTDKRINFKLLQPEVNLAVKIRLRRMGAKKRPMYRFVATDSRMPRDGRFIEILGYYNPIERPAAVNVNEERVYYWLKQGAITTDTVGGLFTQIGLFRKWEMIQKGEDVSQITLATQLKEKTKKKKKKVKEAEVAAPVTEEKAEEPKKKEAKPRAAAPAEKAEAVKEEEKKEPEKREAKPAEAEAKEPKEEKKEPDKKEVKPEEAKGTAEAEAKEPKEEKKKPKKKEAKAEDAEPEKPKEEKEES
jgi:small subunit ribosomal protein S16